MTRDGKRWWLFFGELFALTSSRIDFDNDSEHQCMTTNKWYRWAILKMITPSEFSDTYVLFNQPVNDNIPCALS